MLFPPRTALRIARFINAHKKISIHFQGDKLREIATEGQALENFDLFGS